MSDIKRVFEEIKEQDQRTAVALNRVESAEFSLINSVHLSDYILDAEVLTDGVVYTTDNIRDGDYIPVYAKGIFAVLWGSVETVDYVIQIVSSDDTPDAYSQQYVWEGGTDTDRQLMSQMIMVPFGSDGAISLKAVGTDVSVTLQPIGYWT